MSVTPTRLPRDGANVYSAWERHKLAAAGLRRLSMLGAVFSILTLALEAFVFRPRGTAELKTLIGPAVGTVVSVALHVYAIRRGADVRRPGTLATALAALLALLGGIGVLGQGFASPYPLGLLPVLLCWPLVMPGGVRSALLPMGGGLGVHLVALALGTDGPLPPFARALSVTLLVAVGFAIAAAGVVESWRQRAASASQTDWLTGALTVDDFTQRLKELCALRARDLAPFSLVMFDIDRFRNINADYGRVAGDDVLATMAEAVRAEIRAHDFFGRVGGDEFILVLDQCDGQQALSLVQRLRQRISQTPMEIGGGQVRVTFSAGITSAEMGEGGGPNDLIRAAEAALAKSQETGRSRTALAGNAREPLGKAA